MICPICNLRLCICLLPGDQAREVKKSNAEWQKAYKTSQEKDAKKDNTLHS